MKKMMILVLLIALLPVSAMAMKGMAHNDGDMDMGHGDKDHGQMKMDHAGMGMKGVILLQEDVVDGVKAAAHLMDSKDGKGKMLMLMFTDEKTGEMITNGRVAVKIESPDEKVDGAQKMMKSKGMFGVDVQLDQKGLYHFRIGTKLKDGKKRSFHFHYEG